jgi:hypothetical protein
MTKYSTTVGDLIKNGARPINIEQKDFEPIERPRSAEVNGVTLATDINLSQIIPDVQPGQFFLLNKTIEGKIIGQLYYAPHNDENSLSYIVCAGRNGSWMLDFGEEFIIEYQDHKENGGDVFNSLQFDDEIMRFVSENNLRIKFNTDGTYEMLDARNDDDHQIVISNNLEGFFTVSYGSTHVTEVPSLDDAAAVAGDLENGPIINQVYSFDEFARQPSITHF